MKDQRAREVSAAGSGVGVASGAVLPEMPRASDYPSEAEWLRGMVLGLIAARLVTWSTPGLRALLCLLYLGEPIELHLGIGLPPVEVLVDEDPGGVRAIRSSGGEAAGVRADALHTWRTLCRWAGVPLPAPGRPLPKPKGEV